jgi:hypothetical protein
MLLKMSVIADILRSAESSFTPDSQVDPDEAVYLIKVNYLR